MSSTSEIRYFISSCLRIPRRDSTYVPRQYGSVQNQGEADFVGWAPRGTPDAQRMVWGAQRFRSQVYLPDQPTLY
jgi:hypothetical protein